VEETTESIYGSYLRDLEAHPNPEAFIALIDPEVTADEGRTHEPWPWNGYSELVELIRRAALGGWSSAIVSAELIGHRMMLSKRVRVSADATLELGGPEDGRILWRVMTLQDGRIVHIERCRDELDAVVAMLRR
jgi:hypothetical protein